MKEYFKLFADSDINIGMPTRRHYAHDVRGAKNAHSSSDAFWDQDESKHDTCAVGLSKKAPATSMLLNHEDELCSTSESIHRDPLCFRSIRANSVG